LENVGFLGTIEETGSVDPADADWAHRVGKVEVLGLFVAVVEFELALASEADWEGCEEIEADSAAWDDLFGDGSLFVVAAEVVVRTGFYEIRLKILKGFFTFVRGAWVWVWVPEVADLNKSARLTYVVEGVFIVCERIMMSFNKGRKCQKAQI
jgi:hypothetical protein